MARIISQVDPNTGRRTKVSAVEGRTIEDRQSALTSTFGITNREANKLSNSDIAQMLNSPISSNSLFSQPSFDIQTQAPSTATKGLLAQFEAAGDQFTKNLQTQADTSRQREEDAFGALIKELGGQATPTQLQADAYKESVDPLQGELVDINNQIRQEQHALTRRLQALEKNPNGLFGGALQDAMNDTERESLAKIADLYVIQQGIQGKYDSAKSIADRAIDAQMEVQQRNLDLLKLNYDRNASLWEKDEGRAFEVALDNRQRALDAETEMKKEISDLSLNALQNGAPSSVARQMREAKSVGEAMDIGGRYIDLLDRQLKQQQLSTARTNQLLALASAGDRSAIDSLGFDPSKTEVEVDPTTRRQQTDKIEATDRLIGLASQYKNIIDKYGYTNEVFGNTKVLGQINSIRVQMTAAYKSAETLGTLDRGVLDLMDQLLGTKPTSSIVGFGEEGNIFANTTGRRADKISASMQTFIDEANKSKIQAQLRLGIDPLQETMLGDDDNAEIDSYLNTSTFNAANYY